MEISFQEQSFSQRSKITILGTALLQGVVLYLLHEILFKNTWLSEYRTLAYILNLLAVFVPMTVILTFRQSENNRPYWGFIISLAIALIVFGWQQGSLLNENARLHRPLNWIFDDGVFFIIIVFWFKACFFFKGYLYEKKAIASYPTLFGFSWHNYLTLGLSYIFTFIFFGILMLWAGLFKVVEIDFFKKLFEQEWFMFPVLTSVFAYGILLLRTQVNAVGTIQRILRILLKSLLPILIVIALLFVMVLPFTGINLIWQKGYGSGVILGFLYITLFFFNAVYQDGSENPYNEKISQILKYAITVLLVFCGLCFYGFMSRVEQYGWTEDRLWVAILTIIATTFVTLYSLIILFKKDVWAEWFGKANTGMAVVIMLIMFLILTPIMSLKKISAQSQYDRLTEGLIKAKDFDFAYMSRLGKYGKEKLLLLKEHEDIKEDAELLAQVELSLTKPRRNSRKVLTEVERQKQVKVYPIQSTLETKVWQLLDNQLKYGCDKNRCFVVQYDLNGDQKAEILFFKNTYKDKYSITFIEQRDNKLYQSHRNGKSLNSKVIEKLKRLEVSLRTPKWQDLYVDDMPILFGKDTH